MATSNWVGANGSGGGGPSSAVGTPVTSAVFNQYSACLTLLRLLKVQSLKNTIKDMQQGPFGLFHILLAGKKAELQTRIIAEIDKARSENNANLFNHIYDCIKRNSDRPGWGQSLEASRVVGPGNTLGSASAGASPTSASPSTGYGPGTSSAAGKGTYAAYNHPLASGVPMNKYSWQMPGAYPGGSPSTSTAGIGQAGPRTARATFRPSPFFDVRQHVSTMALCPDAGANERKNVILTFNLTSEVQALLKDPKHQVRLFCTTLEYYNNSVSQPSRAAPTVFPLTCEARVNDRLLSANLKGNRKVSGRVPPPNLNKDSALHLDSRQNKVELSYVNTLYQRYAMICCLVEIHSIDSLVAKVRARPMTVEMVTDSILKLNEDDEIEAGAVKMTLRCPLSAMRIKIPSRSRKCLHRQCFDAETFFQLNEQTPSWSCPVCNQTLNPEDLILDQYVEQILKAVPEDQDSIVVEPDASWHTEDGKVKGGAAKGSTDKGSQANGGSAAWAGAQTTSGGGASNGNQRSQPDVVILDLTPSPPPTPHHAGASSVPASTSTANVAETSSSGQAASSMPASSINATVSGMLNGAQGSGAAPPRRSEPIVIDLTLDSDDDDDPPPPPRTIPSSSRRPPGPPPPPPTGYGMANASASSSTTSLTSAALRQQGSALPARNGSGGSRMDESDSGASRAASADARSVQQGSTGGASRASLGEPASRANATSRPTSHAVASTILHRRTRDENSDAQEDDEDDDDNIVLSPGGAGRRVRRRIGLPGWPEEGASRPGAHETNERGLVRRNGVSSMLEDDDEDDEPLMPRRPRPYSGAGSTHTSAETADTSSSSRRGLLGSPWGGPRPAPSSSGPSPNGQAGGASSGGRLTGDSNAPTDPQRSSLAASTSSLSISHDYGSRSSTSSPSDPRQPRPYSGPQAAVNASSSSYPTGAPPGVYRGWRPPPPSASGRDRDDDRDRDRDRDRERERDRVRGSYRDWDSPRDYDRDRERDRDRHRAALNYGRDSAGPPSSTTLTAGGSTTNRNPSTIHGKTPASYGSGSINTNGAVAPPATVASGSSSVPAVVTARPAIAALPPRPTGAGAIVSRHGLPSRPDAPTSALSSSSSGPVVSAQAASSGSGSSAASGSHTATR
ncbi:E3 SUMO-protein ligase pli1 [Tilletia horrida]|nr:E3 SUMO-protein ligase pli1 [Tilletia horrida]